MNAQQQDIIRLLTARGPMTSRELFDLMQDELGYYGFAATHDQIQRAVESLSKILSKMKTANLLYGYMCPQEKGRPVMVWSAPPSDGYIAGVDEIPEDDKSDGEIYAECSAKHAPQELHDAVNIAAKQVASDIDDMVTNEITNNTIGTLTSPGSIPDDEHAEMESDIAELSSFAVDLQPSSHLLILTDSKRILSGDNCEMKLQRATNQLHVYLNGDMEIHNRAELAQFVGAIERMLP